MHLPGIVSLASAFGGEVSQFAKDDQRVHFGIVDTVKGGGEDSQRVDLMVLAIAPFTALTQSAAQMGFDCIPS